MTPEERELLTKSIEISEENNRMLKSIRRSARFSSFLRTIYWLIILGTAFGTYYFLKPFIDPIVKGYKGMQENIESVRNATSNLPTWLGGKE
jgi:Ni,Fe-hydrogenase I cytochrome b subunit